MTLKTTMAVFLKLQPEQKLETPGTHTILKLESKTLNQNWNHKR